MNDTKRKRLINIWKKISKNIDNLCNDNCEGIDSSLLELGAYAINKPIKTALGDDGVHISDVADYFNVCNRTVSNWIKDNNLNPPKKKEIYDTTFITLDTFEKLKEIKQEWRALK